MTPEVNYSLINVAYISAEAEVEREMYHLLKDVTSGGVSHDNPVSGSGATEVVDTEEHLHLEDAITKGGDTGE